MKIKISKYQATLLADLLYKMYKQPAPALRNNSLEVLVYFHIIQEMYKRYFMKLNDAPDKGVTLNLKNSEACVVFHYTKGNESFYLLYEQIHQDII